MTESEMEDLLWDHSERLLEGELEQIERQPSSSVGRADLVFRDRSGAILVIEIKRGTLGRGAISQLHDYYGMLKRQHPDEPVELMVVANYIPKERKLALHRNDIDYREISERKFRKVAAEVGYTFKSEEPVDSTPHETPRESGSLEPAKQFGGPKDPMAGFGPAFSGSVSRAWYHLKNESGEERFLAFVNARGSCSMRIFNVSTGRFLDKKYEKGNFEDAFADVIRRGQPLSVSQLPNLEKSQQSGLPVHVLNELRGQIGKEPIREAASPQIATRSTNVTSKVEKAWYFMPDQSGAGSFLAFVNAKGNCSARKFASTDGRFLGRRYEPGDFQQAFALLIERSKLVRVRQQPPLVQCEKSGLPEDVLNELKAQV